MRSYIGKRGKPNIPYTRVWEPLRLLQIGSELDTEWGANKDSGPPKRMDCEIPPWLERETKHSLHKNVETSL